MKKHIILTLYGKGAKNNKSTSSNKGLNTKITMPEFSFDLKGPLDSIEVSLIRGAIAVFLIFIIYFVFSLLLTNSLNKKNEEVAKVKEDVTNQVVLANEDLEKLQTKIATYQKLSDNLRNINQELAETYRTKNAIPNLLYHIMNIIPGQVQITSIENTTDKHIVINAKTTDYQYLAYFTAGLKNGGILTNVVSGTAEKQDKTIKVTIEGDLQ